MKLIKNRHSVLRLLAASVLPLIVHSGASIVQINSGLTILSYNDLYHAKSTLKTAAILISAASSYSKATNSCKLLEEKPWSPELQDFHLGLNNSLSYLVYQGTISNQRRFWIARNVSDSCRAINARGKLMTVDCQEELQILCTQSAPLGSSPHSEIPARFHVTVPVGDLQLTGSRELHSFNFLGVRFAARPDRYAYSTVYHGSGNATALQPGVACMQTPGVGSEDCLFLNIWTSFVPSPSEKPARKKLKPVMVWIFGGGFVSGSGYDTEGGTDGTNLASRGDVVVVSLNYRLGNLGFLALDDGITNGNFGLQDIITALKWIKEYIVNFGGDPSRITIFGESAGAAAVRALLASPKAKGLIHGAILQSNPAGFSAFGPYSKYLSVEQHYNSVAVQVLNSIGCLIGKDHLSCLRQVDAKILVNLPVAANFPLIDGTYLVSNGLSFTNANYTAKVPIIIGTNRDETAISVPYPASSNATLEFELISSLLGLDLSWIPSSPLFSLPTTSLDPITNVLNLTARVVTLGSFNCLSLATAYSAAKHQTFPSIYSYIFNRTYQPPNFSTPWCAPPSTIQFPLGDADKEYFKCHAGEVLYPFGTLARQGLEDRDGKDYRFSQLTLDRWASFARTGDPNPDPRWLTARGYLTSKQRVEKAGKWESVKEKKRRRMLMQWDGKMVDSSEEERRQCEALGLGLDYYETV